MGMANQYSNTQSKNNDNSDEQKNTSFHAVLVDSEKIISALNKNARAIIAEQEVLSSKKFQFNKNSSDKYDLDLYRKAERYKNKLIEKGYIVVLEENLEKKNVTKESKYMVRISDKNGCFVEFSYFEYRAVVLDFMESERDYIYSYLIQMAGSNQADLKNIADLICEYLAILCNFKELQIKVYEKIGWDDYDSEKIFKYDKIYNQHSVCDYNDEDKLYIERYNAMQMKCRCTNEIADALSKNGDNKEFFSWINEFCNFVNYSPKSALIISAAATGLIRQLLSYTKENNINMNIVGPPAHGKSIICHFALSLFGNPQELEGSFVDTNTAMDNNRVKRPVIPYVLDERMLKIEESSEKAKRHALIMDIFREYEGKAKEKTAGKGAELSGERTYSPIISTSVESMLDVILKEGRDLGQYRRFIEIELNDKSDLFEDAQMANRAESLAYSQYGYGVKLLVPYLIFAMNKKVKDEEDKEYKKDTEYVINLYNKYIKEIDKSLKKAGDENDLKGLESSTSRFALIITTLKIITEAVDFLEHKEVKGKIDKEMINKVYNVLEQNLIDKMAKVPNKNYNENFAANLHAFINKFEDKGIFKTDKVVAWKKASLQGVFGILVKDDKEKTVELITPTASRYAWVALFGYKLKEEQIKEYISAVEESKGLAKKEEKEKVIADAYRKLGLNLEILTEDNKFKELSSEIDKNITVRIVPNGGVIIGDKKNSGGQELTCIKINMDDDYKDSDNKKED